MHAASSALAHRFTLCCSWPLVGLAAYTILTSLECAATLPIHPKPVHRDERHQHREAGQRRRTHGFLHLDSTLLTSFTHAHTGERGSFLPRTVLRKKDSNELYNCPAAAAPPPP